MRPDLCPRHFFTIGCRKESDDCKPVTRLVQFRFPETLISATTLRGWLSFSISLVNLAKVFTCPRCFLERCKRHVRILRIECVFCLLLLGNRSIVFRGVNRIGDSCSAACSKVLTIASIHWQSSHIQTH